MHKKSLVRAMTVAGLFSPAVTLAAGTWSDARNDAMGGTGVASSHYGSAALTNPALLTKAQASDNVSLILPSVGAVVSDPNKVEDKFDRIKSSWDSIKDLLNSSSGITNPLLRRLALQQGISSFQSLRSDLHSINGDRAYGDAAAATVVAVPNETLPFAVVVKGWGVANAKAVVTDRDLTYLDSVAAGTTIPTSADLNSFTSRAEGAGALVTEYGVAMAKSFSIAGQPVSVGITPKLQRIDTYNYIASINNYSTSDFRNSEFKKSSSGANLDLGFSTDLTSRWSAGLVAQNLIGRRIDTKEVQGIQRTFNLRPLVTAGTAWNTDKLTLATDIDLTPASGFDSEKKNQYAGVGAEYRVLSWAQLRVGYRANMRDSDKNLVTAGLGLSPFGVHLDLTGMVGTESKHTYGAAAKLSFTF
ncbi:conjugal transfer protein TraF [Dickeya fangzhongdai]|uniref:Conjugal transfer protein TraF n=1 Tax=Dickeya fangzhongdai TaxID=1778540 RepID=A0A2K8QIP4_9GAMM|nr:conjugal transfer protein TraF [Dickeya fangzhongdai]ATZ93369.1 conjugal transfer protein TraF [Dickeya fangzhongdai]QOH46802.1 conjugal transfer protein TraF [Dickeya fangzhongdai]QOH51107.1 conjugal transfer protein TraF [Dickeya fangzhongdai]WOY01716.1 conjugal transfer protein TraF [Dickeya fangzhongdai]WOY03017.1 conjugal transfer protein TraF [Dickeya fangzhongdai]